MTESPQPDRGLDRRSFLRLGGLATAAVTFPEVLASCSGDSSSTSEVLRVSQAESVSTLDPQKQGSMTDMSVLSNVFDFLSRRDDDGKLVGGLAKSWKPMTDTRWRFSLRQGVKFHNGEPFDAAAAKFSLDRLLDPKTKSPIVELQYVTQIEVVDSHTIDIVTRSPDPLIPSKVSLFGGVMLPPHYLQDKGDDYFAQHPVGTGAFKFSSFERDSQITLTANAAYYRGAPQVKTLQFKPIPNPSTAVSSLQSGEIDIVTGVTTDATLQLKGNDSVQVDAIPGIRTYYLALDTLSSGPLAKREVRQALNYAVNVPQLVSTVLGGAAKQVPTIIPPQNFGFDPDVSAYPYDPDRAIELLKTAGYPDGFSTQLTGQNTDESIVQAIAGQLSKVGVDAKVRLLDPGSFENGLLSGHSAPLGPMFYVGNTAWTMDASNNLQSFVKSDRRTSRWSNPTADHLVTVEETSLDPAERKDAFSQLQKLMKEEAPFVFLYEVKNLYPMQESVRWPGNALGLLRMDTAQVEA